MFSNLQFLISRTGRRNPNSPFLILRNRHSSSHEIGRHSSALTTIHLILPPRFVIKPISTLAIEGHSARFTCRIISLPACSVSWYHENVELRQSVKYMKRYVGDDFTFIINRTKVRKKQG